MTQSRPEWASVWTPLLQAAVRSGTDYNYRLGVKHFLNWLGGEGGACPMNTAMDVDIALCEYAWWVYENWGGHGKWRLNMALFGVEHYLPALQKKLQLGRRSLTGWNNLRPPIAHPPLNWALTCLIAVEVCRMGHPGAAAAVLLGALGDLLMLGRPYATQNAGQLAALAYLRGEAEVGTPEASAAYRRLAEYAMSIHDRSDLEQIEELMHELVAEGAELRAQIAADEERWIEAGLDPEEQFARKYYDDVRSEGAWGVAWSTMTAVSLAQKLATFTDHWQPRTVAQFNGHDLGEFVWHKHDDTDDLFLVLSGRVTIRRRGNPR